MRLDEVAYSPDIVWITYGWDHFDPSKFERARVGDERYDYTNKPCGGLWACPVNSEWGWSHWCRTEDFRADSLKKSFCFRLKPKAKIYVIDNAEDLGKISLHVSGQYTSRLVFNIDYGRLIESGYDGIYLTDNGLFSCREGVDIEGNKFVPHANWATIPLIQGMSSWDVESICVFNPDVIIPIEKEAEPQGMKSITISESDIRTMVRKIIREISEGQFNVRGVYHVSGNAFDEFKEGNFPCFFFSNKPIRINGSKYTYLCNLSLHNPVKFSCQMSWSYSLWLYLSDSDGRLIPEEEFTREKYDGYLGCPYEFWERVYYDDFAYSVDDAPGLLKSLNLGYDGMIIKGVSEGDTGIDVDDYVVFDAGQIQIVRRY